MGFWIGPPVCFIKGASLSSFATHIRNKSPSLSSHRFYATAHHLFLMSTNEVIPWTALRDAIPVFDGTDPTSTQEWIELVETTFASFPHHLGFCTAAARARLAGAAAELMARYFKNDWSGFKARLLDRFNPVDARVAVQLEIMSGTRYVSGTVFAALDRAVADFELLGTTFAASILSCLARRVPAPVLVSIRFSPADDFLATIATLRESAKKAQLRADRLSGWALASDSVALGTTTGDKAVEAKPVKAKPAEEPRPTQSKSARRRARVKAERAEDKEQIRALATQLQEARRGTDDEPLFQ